MTSQQWNTADYDSHARFVSDLGQPVLDLLQAQPGEPSSTSGAAMASLPGG